MPLIEYSGIGYRGLLIVKRGENYYLFPCTGATLDITPSLIVPDAIHASAYVSGPGADEQSAFRVLYATGQVTYTGTITMPFYLHSDWWTVVKNWMYLDRTTPLEIIYSPDGGTFYRFTDVYVSRAVIDNRGANNLIEVSLDLVARHRDPEFTKDDLPSVQLNLFTRQETQNLVPVPYWRSSVSVENIYTNWSGFEVISWRLEIANNTVVTHVLDPNAEPKIIKQGLCVITGSMTIYRTDGVPIPDHRKGRIIIVVGDAEGARATFTMNNVAVETYPYPMRAPSAITTRDINFQAFGGEYDSSTLKPALEIGGTL